MGILTRQHGVKFVISSDLVPGAAMAKKAPRLRPDTYEVWTGAGWSASVEDAIGFDSLDEADEYVRANYSKISAKPPA
jgi:hypothetical protein